MQFIIGVDTGTTNTKAIALDIDGKLIAQHAVSYAPFPVSTPGYQEQNPDELFQAMLTALKSVIDQTGPEGLLGIGFSSAMHSTIAINSSGKRLTNLITWADLRSEEYAEKLKHTAIGRDVYMHTGTPVHPMSPLCKIQWIRDNIKEAASSDIKFVSIKEFFFYQLCGEWIIDHSIASATGMFDIERKVWYKPALDIAGISQEQLSRPVPTTHIITTVRKEYLDYLGIDNSIPFIVGASDGCLANLGSSAIDPGDVSLTIGTSGAMRMVIDSPKPDPQQRLFNYILDENLYVMGGAINNGGSLLKWYAESFLHRSFERTADFEWFVNEAEKAPAGCDGLIFLPYVQGERAPIWDAKARGVFFGVHSSHGQPHFMRALVEGICFALFQVAESLEESIAPIKNIYASGGFIRSQTWLQILADVFNKDILILNASDASSAGACILGLKAVGKLKNLSTAKSFFESGTIVTPNKESHEVYMRNFRVYAGLYEKLKDEFPKLQ